MRKIMETAASIMLTVVILAVVLGACAALSEMKSTPVTRWF